MTVFSKASILPFFLLANRIIAINDNNIENNHIKLTDSYKEDVEAFTTCSVFCQMVGEHHFEPCNDKCHEMPYAYCIKECDDENKAKNGSIRFSEEKTKNPQFDNCDNKSKYLCK
mgnify:CR=1 FL=1